MSSNNSFDGFPKDKVVLACNKCLEWIYKVRDHNREEISYLYFDFVNAKRPWKINLHFFLVVGKTPRRITREQARKEWKLSDKYKDYSKCIDTFMFKEETIIKKIKAMSENTEEEIVQISTDDFNIIKRGYIWVFKNGNSGGNE